MIGGLSFLAIGGQRNGARDVFALVRVNPCQLVEILHLAGNLHRQIAGIEAANALHPAGSGQNSAAEGLVADAVGADHAHSGDDDAFFHEEVLSN